jgi:glycosyltransferase involved in cell wall biosynthesis/peptidoglycan/xylan/chitin deacetylase (PgdA/CDA1 family)
MRNEFSPAPFFSIIIPTYQRKGLVVSLVRSLARQAFDENFEVIVVVDGSTDGTAGAVRNLPVPYPLTVIEQKNMGAAQARNTGAQASHGKILFFIDDDMEADSQLLAEHARCHRDGADVVIGHMPLHPESPKNFLTRSAAKWADDRLYRLSAANPDIDFHELLTGQLSLKRKIFDSVGIFDTRFTKEGSFGNEDIDFGYRLLQTRCQVIFNPKAVTWQHYEIDPTTYLRRARETGRADVLLARKYPDQQKAILRSVEEGKWINRRFWRQLVNWPALGAPLTNAIDWLTARLVARHDGPVTSRFFSWCTAIQYWRGVRDSGGVPHGQTLRVLAYHAISDLSGSGVLYDYGVPPVNFRKQLDTLTKAGFQFISLTEFEHFVTGKAALPSKALLLTFDDCYTDLLEVALPILEEKKISALAFAVSRCLGGTNIWDEKIGAPPLRLLNAEKLLEASRRGIEVGSHSRTHPQLTGTTEENLAKEIGGSLNDLEAIGLNRPRFLAYPFGAHDGRVRDAARAAGVIAAFTVTPGVLRQNGDRMQVPRIEILRDDAGRHLLWKVDLAPRLRKWFRR